jgi:hypothetical protein
VKLAYFVTYGDCNASDTMDGVTTSDNRTLTTRPGDDPPKWVYVVKDVSGDPGSTTLQVKISGTNFPVPINLTS